mmetsp:Transcript_2413/g.7684  ORF Transcript_2413/g.7684 Transcript_2413/m.7684 type:complete len:205 (-) Transcript_2413:684-1298(-)
MCAASSMGGSSSDAVRLTDEPVSVSRSESAASRWCAASRCATPCANHAQKWPKCSRVTQPARMGGADPTSCSHNMARTHASSLSETKPTADGPYSSVTRARHHSSKGTSVSNEPPVIQWRRQKSCPHTPGTDSRTAARFSHAMRRPKVGRSSASCTQHRVTMRRSVRWRSRRMLGRRRSSATTLPKWLKNSKGVMSSNMAARSE